MTDDQFNSFHSEQSFINGRIWDMNASEKNQMRHQQLLLVNGIQNGQHDEDDDDKVNGVDDDEDVNDDNDDAKILFPFYLLSSLLYSL